MRRKLLTLSLACLAVAGCNNDQQAPTNQPAIKVRGSEQERLHDHVVTWAREAPGEGAVIGDGLAQKAVHRDQAGVLHAVSARCTWAAPTGRAARRHSSARRCMRRVIGPDRHRSPISSRIASESRSTGSRSAFPISHPFSTKS